MALPNPNQLEGVLYDVFETQPFGRGFSKVFNNTANTLLKGRALHLDTDGVVYADASALLDCSGFAWGDIDPNTFGWMAHDTTVYYLDWFLLSSPSAQYLTQGSKYYLADNGTISLLPSAGLAQEVGTAMSIHELSIELQSVGGAGGGAVGLGPILAAIAALQTDLTALDFVAMKKPEYDIDNNLVVDDVDEFRDIFTITAFGQTDFTLSRSPLQPMFSKLKVNGVTQYYGINYTIAGTALTYLPGTAPTIQLEPTDYIEILYR
jgi:hypothetical protein